MKVKISTRKRKTRTKNKKWRPATTQKRGDTEKPDE